MGPIFHRTTAHTIYERKAKFNLPGKITARIDAPILIIIKVVGLLIQGNTRLGEITRANCRPKRGFKKPRNSVEE